MKKAVTYKTSGVDIDKANALPDIETLECRNATLMTLLQEVTDVNADGIGYHIDFESQEYHREPQNFQLRLF